MPEHRQFLHHGPTRQTVRVVGYSGTPLERKLGVGEHAVFLDGAPEGFDLDARVVRRLPRELALALTFHTSAGRLERRLGQLVAQRSTRPGVV